MAVAELFANQPATTVSSGGTDAPSSGTSQTWTVASSSAFPAAVTGTSQFHACDTAAGKVSEIIAVTNVSGTTWTVTRGAESTTPVAHAPGFTIMQVVTAGALALFLQAESNLSDVASQQAALNNIAGAVTSAEFLRGNGSNVQMSAIQASDVPTLNQSTTGNAGTATNLAGGATFPDYVAPATAALTDGSSVALNAALGNDFSWALGGSSHTLALPSNPVNRQLIVVWIKYSGSYTPLFNAGYDFGAAGQPSWSAASGKTDCAAWRYNSALAGGSGAWACQGCLLGLTS